jgi:hypothetical protein
MEYGALQADWTDPETYAHMRGYEPAGFAAEYLVRNHDFVAECADLASTAEEGALLGSPAFAARWGARFHGWSRPASACR